MMDGQLSQMYIKGRGHKNVAHLSSIRNHRVTFNIGVHRYRNILNGISPKTKSINETSGLVGLTASYPL